MNGEQQRGIFLSEKELPPQAWAAFIAIARASGYTPQEYLKRIILQDIKNFKLRQVPIVERVINAAVAEVNKMVAGRLSK